MTISEKRLFWSSSVGKIFSPVTALDTLSVTMAVSWTLPWLSSRALTAIGVVVENSGTLFSRMVPSWVTSPSISA